MSMHSFSKICTTATLFSLAFSLVLFPFPPLLASARAASKPPPPPPPPINMTKHSLLNIVSANLGLGENSQPDQNPPSHPPPPQFHIASKDHFVHPLPGTYPRLALLSDSSILFGFTSFASHQQILSIARSIDNGRTFTPLGEVVRSPGDADNMFLLQLPSGAILAAFRNHDYHPNTTMYSQFRITICQSVDGGRGWEFLSQGFEKPAPFGLWEPFLRRGRVREGEIQLYFSGEVGEDDQDTFLCLSRDGGRSWTAPVAVTGGQHSGRLRDGMVGIAETRDTLGREVLVIVLETTRGEGGRKYAVECLLSYDDGLSWGWRQSVYMPQGGRKNAGAPQVAAFGDGEVAVVFMTDEDGGGEEWPGGAKIKVLFGGRPDNGRVGWREGGRPRVVSSSTGSVSGEVGGAEGEGEVSPGQIVDAFWPGVVKLAGDKLLAVYVNGGIIKGKVITKG